VTCEDVRELFSARVDDALTADERARLDAHVTSCPECAREWQRFERAVELLRAVEPARAPAGFVDRVLAARPRPWYRRLARGLLVPWPVKVPLDAAAIVLVAGLAIVVFQRSPGLQQAARAPAPPADRVEAPSSQPAAPPPATESLPTSERRPSATPTPTVAPPPATVAPPPAPTRQAPTRQKEAGSALGDEAKRQESAADARARGADVPRSSPRRDAEPDGDRAARVRQAAPPPGASGRVQSLAARPIDVEARLVVTERTAAERAVGDLVARAGGHVVSRGDDGAATVLGLAIPAERWDDLRHELTRVGILRVDRSAPRAGHLRVVLRLEP
jgi:Putative zinc-finger